MKAFGNDKQGGANALSPLQEPKPSKQAKHDGAALPATLGAKPRSWLSLAQKLMQAELASVKLEHQPQLAEQGKRACAIGGQRIAVASPELADDPRLIAHEAAHLIQQRGGKVIPAPGAERSTSQEERKTPDLEAEADNAAQIFLGTELPAQGLTLSATTQGVLYEQRYTSFSQRSTVTDELDGQVIKLDAGTRLLVLSEHQGQVVAEVLPASRYTGYTVVIDDPQALQPELDAEELGDPAELPDRVCVVMFQNAGRFDEDDPSVYYDFDRKTFAKVGAELVAARSNCFGFNPGTGKLMPNAPMVFRHGEDIVEGLRSIGKLLAEQRPENPPKIAEVHLIGHGVEYGLLSDSEHGREGLVSDPIDPETGEDYEGGESLRTPEALTPVARDYMVGDVKVVLHSCSGSANRSEGRVSLGEALLQALEAGLKSGEVEVYGHRGSSKAGYDCPWVQHKIGGDEQLEDNTPVVTLPEDIAAGIKRGECRSQ
ncbi:MAG: hypothetical protein RBU37_03890 [Myxococcota bacterium]|jgi:hypothetical protein|nr:hypothetical protein [Myxococcota bacterium]